MRTYSFMIKLKQRATTVCFCRSLSTILSAQQYGRERRIELGTLVRRILSHDCILLELSLTDTFSAATARSRASGEDYMFLCIVGKT